MAGLSVAAKAAGLQAEGVQVSREALPDQDMPAIAYVNNNHFIAVLSVQGSGENGTAIIHDPNSAGEETIPQERLLRLCSGYLLCCVGNGGGENTRLESTSGLRTRMPPPLGRGSQAALL
jgi:ABC-type bacteriocin/lantibiotic exporter with double-glycine peptidase domain